MKKKLIALIVAIVVIGAGGYYYSRIRQSKTAVTQTTSTVTKGTLITSIAATGTITSGNTTNISTKASGTVTKVYVKNGDMVKKGQKILDIALDSDGVERRSTAWQAYLKTQEDAVVASKDKQDLSIQIWKDKQAILDAQTAVDYMNAHTTNPATNKDYTDADKNEILQAVDQARLAFDVDAAKFSHADSVISAAKITQSAAYLDYQDVSGSIIAPASGIMNNLTLTVGSTLTANSTQSTTSGASLASSQTIGFVRAANNQYQAKVSLTEVDAPKVKAGQSVNITMDAHSDKSFTGKVLAVDISGSSTSGVTSYPATIVMDPTDLPIYPNMSVSSNIITNVETDVLLVPTSAVTTNNGASTVQVLKDGKTTTVTVEVGDSNDTQTVIKSGLSEGDTVITGSATSAKNNNTSSVFSNTRNGAAGAVFRGPGF